MVIRTKPSSAPGYPSWGFMRHVPLAPEGDGAVAAPAAVVAPVVAAVAKVEPPPIPGTLGAAVAKVEPPSLPPAAKVDAATGKPDPYAARFEALEKANEELRAQLAGVAADSTKSSATVRQRLAHELFTSVEMQPKYFKQALAELGDLDPSTDAAKAKLDEFTKAFPESLAPKQSTDTLNSEWVKRIAERQKDAAKTRGTMLGAVSAEQLATITGRNR